MSAHKRHAKRGPKPRRGDTMVPVSIRMLEAEVKEIDEAAAERASKMKVSWSRTDEIRERLQDTFASRDPVEAQARGLADKLLGHLSADRAALVRMIFRDDAVLVELRELRALVASLRSGQRTDWRRV